MTEVPTATQRWGSVAPAAGHHRIVMVNMRLPALKAKISFISYKAPLPVAGGDRAKAEVIVDGQDYASHSECLHRALHARGHESTGGDMPLGWLDAHRPGLLKRAAELNCKGLSPWAFPLTPSPHTL